MKKILLGLVVLLGLTLGLGMVEVNASEPSVGQSVSYSFRFNSNGVQGGPSTLTANYGSLVTIDNGSLSQESTYVGFIDQGKVHPVLNTATSIRLTERTNIEIFYKDNGNSAVIFMDSNKNFLDIAYTQGNGMLLEGDIVDYTTLSKPGLNVTGWNIQNIGSHVFSADTIVYPIYNNALGTKTLTVDGGTGAGTYNFDQYVTVVADIEGFDYWLKDGVLASLDPEYTFTMAADHHLVAIYNDDTFTPNLGSFVTVSDIIPINNDFVAIMGQFDLAFSEEIVEWGIIKSDNYAGAITFNTPDAEVIYSKNYNADTNEFVLFFDAAETYPNFRAFVTTYNTISETVTTSYSYLQEEEVVSMYASDLIISEYLDWNGGTNKAIELYNGTGFEIILSNYSIKTSANGGTSWTSTTALTGTLSSGETYVLANAVLETITGIRDLTSTINFNGNDAIGLFYGETLIDIFGVFNHDPGTAWELEGGNTADTTVIRKATVVSPYVGVVDIGGIEYTGWNSSEWYAISETVETLGSHTMNLPTFTRQFTGLISAPDQLQLTEALGLTEIFVGQSATITLTYPNGGLEGVYWVSDNDSVFTFNSSTGEVVGVAPGTGKVYAYSYYNHNVVAEYTFTVNEVQTFDVTFVYNDEVTSNLVEVVNGGETVSAPVEPTRTGFEFDGWYANPELTTPYEFSSPVLGDISIYAKWNVIYDIIYNLDGGTNNLDNPSTYTVKTPTIVLEAPTKASNVFAGWYESSDFSGTEVIEISLGSTGEITLYAKWIDESTPVETVLYQTGFENATKGAYGVGDVNIDGVSWKLSEALIGNLADDKKTDTKSIRGRAVGFAMTNEGFSNVTKVEFKFAHYGTLTAGILSLEISPDNGGTWVTIWEMTSGTYNSLESVSLDINYESYSNLEFGDVLLFKWVFSGTSGNNSRMNIDDVVIYGIPE